MALRKKLARLYLGSDKMGVRFRFGLLTFDVVTILFFIVSSLLEPSRFLFTLDYLLAFILFLDLLARAVISKRPAKFLMTFGAVADVIVILSLLASAFIENLAFLRVVRMLRLLRSYHVIRELRDAMPFFRKNEEIIQSTVNLLVFVFVITAIVFVLEVDRNQSINNYLDALYFTITTLTTTGFGDITLSDTLGRMVAVIIMVFGVGLFLRLVQTIFRPNKVAYPCPTCGLNRHEGDAVHCKHCGSLLNIPTSGDWS